MRGLRGAWTATARGQRSAVRCMFGTCGVAPIRIEVTSCYFDRRGSRRRSTRRAATRARGERGPRCATPLRPLLWPCARLRGADRLGYRLASGAGTHSRRRRCVVRRRRKEAVGDFGRSDGLARRARGTVGETGLEPVPWTPAAPQTGDDEPDPRHGGAGLVTDVSPCLAPAVK